MKTLTSTALLLAGSASLLLVNPAPASADTVTLNNGREIHGRLVEEGKKVILIKTGSGVITIPKFKVATFSENENWGNYSKPRSVSELKAIEEANRKGAEKAVEKDPKKGQPKTPKTKGDKTVAGEWTWDEEVSKATIEELTPLRDELLAQLEALGPTEKERLAKLVLSREEEPDLKEKIRLLGWKRGRGRRGGIAGSAVYRNKAKKEIVANYGPRAISALAKTLGSENLYQARWAAQTLQEIHAQADKADSLWLMNHFEVPTGLVELMNNIGDTTSPFVRKEANAALEAISGESMNWPDNAQNPGASPQETTALKKWRKWSARNHLAFKKNEEDKEINRTTYREKLDLIREGQNPEEPSEEE